LSIVVIWGGAPFYAVVRRKADHFVRRRRFFGRTGWPSGLRFGPFAARGDRSL